MPSFQAPEAGLWDSIKNAASGAASTATSTVQSAGSAVSDWLGMGSDVPDYGPVIGPQLPLEDLYGEDNGDGGGGLPFGLLDEEQIREINESARRAGGGGAPSPYDGDGTEIPFVPPSYDDMIVY